MAAAAGSVRAEPSRAARAPATTHSVIRARALEPAEPAADGGNARSADGRALLAVCCPVCTPVAVYPRVPLEVKWSASSVPLASAMTHSAIARALQQCGRRRREGALCRRQRIIPCVPRWRYTPRVHREGVAVECPFGDQPTGTPSNLAAAVHAHRQAQWQVGHGFLGLPNRKRDIKTAKPGKKARGGGGGGGVRGVRRGHRDKHPPPKPTV